MAGVKTKALGSSACGLACLILLSARAEDATSTNVTVRKIWDAAPHNAFTDLLRFKGQWFCVFREGKGHVSPDGALRVLRSEDGQTWTSAALLRDENSDLRDPKITITPEGRLMLTGAAALRPPAGAKHQTRVWFSDDGTKWTEPRDIGDPNVWLWRVTWRKGKAYGVGYSTDGGKFVRLYSSSDGQRFDPLISTLFNEGQPSEAALVFDAEDRCYCLLRRDGTDASGKLGVARPPYKEWQWKDLKFKIGGPQMLLLPDGRFVAGVRLYDEKVRTSLAWIDPDRGQLDEFVKLPSSGDSSYPGLVWHEGQLWMSYYSSHEGKTSIYLARVELPRKS
jgi:hypothetical protein